MEKFNSGRLERADTKLEKKYIKTTRELKKVFKYGGPKDIDRMLEKELELAEKLEDFNR